MFQQHHVNTLHSTNKIILNKFVSTHDVIVYRERRVISPVILNFGNRRRLSGQFHALAALPPEKNTVLPAQEAGYAPRAGLGILEKRISCLCWDLNLGCPAHNLVTNLTILSLFSLNFTKKLHS